MEVHVERLQGRRLRVRARDHELVVDDPPEHGGEGGLRPTELLLAALGTCMAGTLITFARNQQIPVERVRLRLADEVVERPERVGTIVVEMEVAGHINDRQRASLERAASHCKIHNTLGAPPRIQLAFTATAPAEATGGG